MTSCLSCSYCCLHCFLSAASLGLAPPWGWGCFFKAATHFSKSGGSGTADAPPWPCPFAAFLNQRSNSFLVITASPTLATPLAGTSLPQPDTSATAARAAKEKRARVGLASLEVI